MDNADRQRYARHLLLPGMDEESYERLRQARVLVVGAGGLGSPALYYLAAAGVGTIGVVDHDVIELSNLQRQALFTTDDLGKPKADTAAARMVALNPGVTVIPYHRLFDETMARELVPEYDVVATCVDNTSARYAANDECVREHKVLVDAAVAHYAGQAMTIVGGETACYRCLFPVPPAEGEVPYQQNNGILGPVAGTMGAIQAAEVIKAITGVGKLLVNQLLTMDLHDMTFDVIPMQRDEDCPVCGAHSAT